MQVNITKLSAMVESLGKKCEELKARASWHNIRLVGLPEGTEGPQPTEFVAKLLMDLFELDRLPGLDRTHRTLRAKPKEGEPPRPMVIRVTQFQTRNTVLDRAPPDTQREKGAHFPGLYTDCDQAESGFRPGEEGAPCLC